MKEQSYKIPKNWKWVQFGDITSERLIGIVRSSKEQSSLYSSPYVKMDSILLNGNLNLNSVTRVEATASEIERYSLRQGDFLFNTRNSYELVGKTGIFPLNENGWLYNNNIMRVRFIEGISSRYINYVFHSPLIRCQLELLKRKTTNVCAIYDSQLVEIKIPLPPIAEQKRIAAILDKAEELRGLRCKALEELDTLTQSIFLEMFGDPITNPKGWQYKSIQEIGQVITGNTPSRSHLEFYGDEIEWIKSDNINTPYHYITQATERLSEAGKKVARIAPPSSILVTCIAGTPECIGNAAMVDREVAFNQQINALIPITGDFRFLYTQIFVNKSLIQNASTSSMKGMVSKSRFEKIKMIFPPLHLQKEFGDIFEKLESTRVFHRESLAQLDALFASLQHRAFRGEL